MRRLELSRQLFTGTAASGTPRVIGIEEPARVRAMFVHPSHARRGIGRAILAHCEAAARARGHITVELMATLPGEPLYLACGYRVIERVDLALPDGVIIEAARMSKTVDAASNPADA